MTQQPSSQGLSSSCPRKRERGDPGWGWSCVSQNRRDCKYVILVGAGHCDETRRPEWVFPKARQNTLKKKKKTEHLPFPQPRNTIKIGLN